MSKSKSRKKFSSNVEKKKRKERSKQLPARKRLFKRFVLTSKADSFPSTLQVRSKIKLMNFLEPMKMNTIASLQSSKLKCETGTRRKRNLKKKDQLRWNVNKKKHRKLRCKRRTGLDWCVKSGKCFLAQLLLARKLFSRVAILDQRGISIKKFTMLHSRMMT